MHLRATPAAARLFAQRAVALGPRLRIFRWCNCWSLRDQRVTFRFSREPSGPISAFALRSAAVAREVGPSAAVAARGVGQGRGSRPAALTGSPAGGSSLVNRQPLDDGELSPGAFRASVAGTPHVSRRAGTGSASDCRLSWTRYLPSWAGATPLHSRPPAADSPGTRRPLAAQPARPLLQPPGNLRSDQPASLPGRNSSEDWMRP